MESRRVLIELYAGIFLCTIAGVVLGVVLGIICGGYAWWFIPGLIAGAFTACYQAYHIYRSLDKALGSEDGKKLLVAMKASDGYHGKNSKKKLQNVKMR